MSTQAIDDYLTKQISIENNIVTCRSLSRALGLHVNVAKNELATYFSKAETRHDTLFATYRLTGMLKPDAKNHTDTQDEEGYNETEADPVFETESTLVSGTELPTIKAQYSKVFSLYIYSLSPSEIRDCGLICNSESVRSIDRAKGDDFAKTVGKIVGDNIKVVPEKLKKGTKPAKEPVAGPSKVKPEESIVDLKSKNKPATESLEPTAKKSSATKDGKLDFFKAKPKAKSIVPEDAKEALAGKLTAKAPLAFFKLEKKDSGKIPSRKSKSAETEEDSVSTSSSNKTNTKPADKKMKTDSESSIPALKIEKKETKGAKVKRKALLSESESEAPSMTKAKKKEEPKRLVKRKSEAVESETEDVQVKQKRRVSKRKSPASDSDDDDDRPPSKVTTSLANKRNTKRKSTALDSDDDAPSKDSAKKSNAPDSDDDDAPIVRRKRPIKKVIPDVEHNSDLEAMMAMDDDDVVRISRDKEPSVQDDDSDIEQNQSVVETKDEDDMDVDVPPVPKKKPTRKPKVVIPVGKNGLKKRRIVKERVTQDAKGYDVTEDYSSWESVSEEEAPEPKKSKPKPKPKAKVETEGDTDVDTPPPKAVKPKETVKKETVESESKLSLKPKPAKKAAPKKGQQNISSFFGKKK